MYLGLHLGACPHMGAILATATDSTWNFEDLMKHTVCTHCNSERINVWYSCNRRSAMVNLHPGLASARRQHYFILNLLAKYSAARDNEIQYAGHPDTRSDVREYRFPDKSVPKPLQTHTYICHGKTTIINSA